MGQEEVQYKVLTEQFGLTDMAVRNWTNGPGFLTWSRGQNSHGNGIGGPLPRSFMRGQWALQKQVLARYRELGILGHLPAFGGWAPWALAVKEHDTNPRGNHATRGVCHPYKDCDTAWIDGRDPLFTRVADAWIKQVIEDFGSDHAWQMDGFFGNGTGWGGAEQPPQESSGHWLEDTSLSDFAGQRQDRDGSSDPDTYTKMVGVDSHIARANKGACADGTCQALRCGVTTPCGKMGCFGKSSTPCDIVALEQACTADPKCAGFNSNGWLKPCVTSSCGAEQMEADGCDLYVGSRLAPPLPPDPVFYARAKAAYGAIERADGPTARWIFQGWALHVAGSGMSPPGPTTLSRVHGFSAAAPPGNFILMDMAASGQWKEWDGKWGIPFIWTSLPDFGGNLYMHGNLSEINQIPFEAPPLSPAPAGYDPKTQVVGSGYTPEGLDQNTAYYELLQEAAFKAQPEPNLVGWLVKRAHRRYGLNGGENPDVSAAWTALRNAGYANDGPVHDPTPVGQFPVGAVPAWMGFAGNTPKPALCHNWRAWGSLIAAATKLQSPMPEPFGYDLVDVGREVLSQLAIPMADNFSKALSIGPDHLFATTPHTASDIAAAANDGDDDDVGAAPDPARLNHTGWLYVDVLRDLDTLLTTDQAFLLGSWLMRARRLGGNATDCTDTVLGAQLSKCSDFMEWNARAQLTTWHPVDSPTHPSPNPEGAGGVWPGHINDYAKKQWAGLVGGYYAVRIDRCFFDIGMSAAAKGEPVSTTAVKQCQAALAYSWQTDWGDDKYPSQPVGNSVAVSAALRAKYAPYFASCAN